MGGYADPVNEDANRPATAAEADAQNRIGRENRQRVGLSGYGGRSEYELAEIDYREQQRQEVVQTRREKEQASERNQQASGDSGIDYAVSSRENVRNRPGYTDPDTLGDSRTRMIARLLGFDSENIPEAAQGVILEEQRQKAYDTPTLKDDFFYGAQLEKWKQNKIELSSEYHHETLASGLQQKANPYEYAGDLALESLKGSPRKGSEYTSPSSGSMRDVLPNGRGLQEVMWDSAIARDRGVPQSERVSFMDSVRVINAAEGLYGSYGSLYGGKVDNRSAFDVLGAQKNAEAPMVYTEANAQAPFLAVGVTHQEILVPSEFDLMAMQANIPIVSGAAVATSDFLFGGRSKVIIDTGRPVYGPEEISYGTPTRTIRELEDGSTVITTNTPVFSTRSVFTPVTTRSEVIPSGFDYGQSKFAEQVTQRVSPELKLPRTGTTADYNISLVEGGYNELRNKPLTAAMNVGVGMLFVAGGEAVAGLGAGTVAATQGMRFIGPVAKGANFLVNKVAPPVLAGMYFTDVAGRSTQWGTDFSTESTKRLGGILTTETIPMIAGGMAFANRGAIVSGAKDVYGRVMENPPTFRGVKEGIENRVFEFRQGRAGIENIGVRSRTSYTEFAKEYTGNPVEYSRGGEIGKFLDEAPAGWFRTEPQPTTRSVNIPDESRYAYMEYLQGSDVPLLETSRSVTTRPIWGTSRTTVTSARFEPEFVELSQITPGNRKSTIVFEREGMGSFGGVEAWTPSKTGTKTVTTRENVQINPYSGETMIWGDRTTVFTPSQPKLAVERFAGVINIFDLPPTVKVAGVSPEVPPVTAITKMSFKMGDIETGGNRVYNQYGELYESGKIIEYDLNKGTTGFVREQVRTTEINKAFSDILEAPEPALSGISGYDKPNPRQGHQFDIKTVRIPQQPTETVTIPRTAKPKEFVRPSKAGGQQVFFEPTLQDRASVRIQDMFADLNRDVRPVQKSRELLNIEAQTARQRTMEINAARFQKGFVSEATANNTVRVYYEPVPTVMDSHMQAQQQLQNETPAMYMSPFATIRKFTSAESGFQQTYPKASAPERTVSAMRGIVQLPRQDDDTAIAAVAFPAMSGYALESSMDNRRMVDRFRTTDIDQSGKTKRKQGIIPAIDITRDAFTDQTPIIDQLNRQRIITDQDIIPRIDTQITPDIVPVTTPDVIPDITRGAPPIPPVILGGIGLPSSGSSGGGYSPEPRITTWVFSNPVGAERLIADRGKKMKPMKGMGIKKFKPMPKF